VPDHGERKLRRGTIAFDVDRDMRLTSSVGGASRTIALPYPRAGYGGHELVVSPDESLLAVYLFSGQSEQGWELFALAPELRHLGGLPYARGEGDAPQFSPDGAWLAMLVAVPVRVRDSDDDFEAVSDPQRDDVVLVDWAHLHIQRVPAGEIERHALGVRVPRSLDPDELGEWRTYEAMRFVAADCLELTMPWGERITCSLPLSESPVAISSPATR
jgi:hypothetical protein